MKNKEVQIGKKYVAKVSGRLAIVQIEKVKQYGGWDARNMRTGRMIYIRSGRRLRREYTEGFSREYIKAMESVEREQEHENNNR